MPSPGYVPWSGVDDGRRKIMQANRSRDTGPEMRLRSLLHREGLRFRVSPLLRIDGRRIRPDVAFPRWKVAVFVDGCFWHGCPEHGTTPKSNAAYWVPKIEGNRARDESNDTALRQAGWIVVRAWEHEPPRLVAERVSNALRSAQGEREPGAYRTQNLPTAHAVSTDQGMQTDLMAWADELEAERQRVREANEQRAARRGFIVFATDPERSPHEPGYREVYAREAKTPNEALKKVRPLASGRRLRSYLATGSYRDELADACWVT